MFKKGFTLAETLISLTIIGVIAALTMPGLLGTQPSKTKTTYMKAYNALTNLTSDIINDPSLYWTQYDNNGNVSAEGLNNWDTVDIAPYNNLKAKNGTVWACEWNRKFPLIMFTKLNTAGPYWVGGFSDNYTYFDTTDGLRWTFCEYLINSSGKLITHYLVWVDINGDKGVNCIYSSSCSKPDKFRFEVDDQGGVRPADALGIAFLQNPTDMRSASDDKNLAAKLISGISVSDGYNLTQIGKEIDHMYTNLSKQK